MKIGVIGSRTFEDTSYIYNQLSEGIEESIEPNQCLVLLVGDNQGVDRVAKDMADSVIMKPYYLLDREVSFSARHYFVRNKQIMDNADCMIFLWDGSEDEVLKAIKYCERIKKPLVVKGVQETMEVSF